jgi:alpha-methylacyl-CoA racemase
MPTILDGIRVLELAGIGPGPHAAMILADMGADVVRVERPAGATEMLPREQDFVLRNRRSVTANLKDPEDRDSILRLVDKADILLEGYRPGVAERLGIGPDTCRERNPRLIYGRMTGWGQDGPLAHAAGHDINYLAMSGALNMIGREESKPLAPLNLVGDLGGGSLFLVVGVLGALFERERSGQGQIVDTAMIDGVSTLMAMYWTLAEHGLWSSARGTNMTDGGGPFYDTYRCSDGRYMAVGAVEPQFYDRLLRGLGLDRDEMPAQMDESSWPAVRQQFTDIMATKSRDDWTSIFSELDAGVTPVLALDEVAEHDHIRARGTIRRVHDHRQPMPAPRFSRSQAPALTPPPAPGSDNERVFADWGVSDDAGRDDRLNRGARSRGPAAR